MSRIAKAEKERAADHAARAATEKARRAFELQVRVSSGAASEEEVDQALTNEAIGAEQHARLVEELERQAEDRRRRTAGIARIAEILARGEKPDPSNPTDRAAVEAHFESVAGASPNSRPKTARWPGTSTSSRRVSCPRRSGTPFSAGFSLPIPPPRWPRRKGSPSSRTPIPLQPKAYLKSTMPAPASQPNRGGRSREGVLFKSRNAVGDGYPHSREVALSPPNKKTVRRAAVIIAKRRRGNIYTHEVQVPGLARVVWRPDPRRFRGARTVAKRRPGSCQTLTIPANLSKGAMRSNDRKKQGGRGQGLP